MKYVKGFDTIRAFAVLTVIVGHWGPYLTPNTPANTIMESFFQFGRFGVTIFFVLSGFLITSILLNEKIKNPPERRFSVIKNFFARRILRIFPLYYLFILGYFLANDSYVRSHIWYFLTYSSNLLRGDTDNPLPHFWSLAVEEQFYLVWPWLILLINRKYLKYVFYISILTGITSQYISYYIFHQQQGVISINCFDSFGIGALYAYARLDQAKCAKFEQRFRVLFPLMLFAAWKLVSINGLPIGVLYLRLLDNLIALAMIMFALNNQTEWVRKYVMENKALNFIGKISYGVYAYHFTVGDCYVNYMAYLMKKYPSMPPILYNFYFSYCIKLALLITVCWLSFRFIEQPIMRLKKKFEYASK